MRKWHVFIDESGAFEVEDPYPVLGALVVPTPDIETFERWARGRLEQALPHVPWPPHTTFLNLPIYHAFAAVASGNAGPEDELLIDHLHSAVGARIDDIVQRLRNRQKVKREPLTYYANWLAQEGAEFADALAHLENRLRETENGVRNLLAEAGRACQGAFIASSAETFDCEAAFHPDGRYFVVLEALVERIHDSIARMDEDTSVRVSALELDVDIGLRRRSLTRDLLAHGVGCVTDSRPGSRVHLSAGDVPRYDLHVTAGFVLADFVANRAGNVLRFNGGPPLRRAQETLVMRVGLPVSSGNPTASHLAASGAARAALAAARVGSPAPDWPDGSRKWAKDQAEQWALIRV
jgi:hypothetical protein